MPLSLPTLANQVGGWASLLPALERIRTHVLADVLARINERPMRDLDALLPWNRRQPAGNQLIADAA